MSTSSTCFKAVPLASTRHSVCCTPLVFLKFVVGDLRSCGRRFRFCDSLGNAFSRAAVGLNCAFGSIIGGLIETSALPNFQTVCCVSGSCLRMPHPAGHRGLS